MNEFDFLKGLGGFGSAIGVLVILWRLGLVQLGKNGKNGNGHKDNTIELLKIQFTAMQENHMHEMRDIAESLREIKETLKEVRDFTRDSFQILDSRKKE